MLQDLDKPAIIPHMAEQEGKRFLYEVIFRYMFQVPAGMQLRSSSAASRTSCTSQPIMFCRTSYLQNLL